MLSIDTIQAYFERRGIDLEYANEYGEPGYSTDKPCILFANWNNVPKKVYEAIERSYECEWSDEWTIDYENNAKAYRTSPDSYGWTPSATYLDDGDLFTVDDLDRDPDRYIEHLLNNPCNAMTPHLRLDLREHGFALAGTDYESGWHPGQTDDPRKILKRLHEANPDVEVIFEITDTGQFDTRWQVWTRTPAEESDE